MSAALAIRDEALRLAETRGWSIIPVRGKRAACKWGQYQTERPDPSTLRRWFGPSGPRGITGLAVILGDVSGGLVCRDFDDAPAYKRWRESAPVLAKILPTVETGRGFHVYGRRAGERLRDAPGGEFRAAGGYTLLPASVHPSGKVYRYITPLPPGDLPELSDADVAGLITATERTETTQTTETTERTEEVERGESWSPEVESAITDTLPTNFGQRWRRVFQFARALKAIPALADAPLDILKPLVRRWWMRALPTIRTKAFEETWIDFAKGWPKVRLPAGQDAMNIIVERAKGAPAPAATVEYGEPVQLLASICRELQKSAGPGTFYLGTRTAGRLLGVDHTTAWRWLFLLTADRLLEVVEVGGQAHNPRRATRYRWVGGA